MKIVKKHSCIYFDKPGRNQGGVCCEGGNCEVCGWNPEEQQRRLARGKLVPGPVVTIRIYAGEDDKTGREEEYEGLRSLLYPPRYSKGKGKRS